MIARPGGLFSEKVDGSTAETRTWLGGPFLLLSRFRPEVYRVIAVPALAEVANRPDMVARILWAKDLAAGGGPRDGGVVVADASAPSDAGADQASPPRADAGLAADAAGGAGEGGPRDAAFRADLAAPPPEDPSMPMPPRPAAARGGACSSVPAGPAPAFLLVLVIAAAVRTLLRHR